MSDPVRQELERELEDIRVIQKGEAHAEVGKIESMRQDFLLKKNENELVKQELDLMTEDSKVYKLIGPALVPQTLPDAQSNVNKRLEFIDHEL
jgi:prefoldin beta subunit